MSSFSTKARQGISLFNQRQFFTAHEYFEDAWRETTDESREFYRALLHISGGFFRLSQDRPSAARKFFSRALDWLTRFENPTFGFNTAKLRRYIEILIQAIDQEEDSAAILKAHFQPIQPSDE